MAHVFEFYETPDAFSRYLFQTIEVEGQIYAPCVGSGAIIRAAATVPGRRQWVTNDIDPRWPASTHLDATRPEAWAIEPDWTVDNPPFSPALEIAELAIQRSRVGVALHLRASIHEVLKTGPRRTWMRRHPPTGILWLPRFAYQRSQKTGEWATDSVCACWVIWQRGAPALIDYAPEWVLEELKAGEQAYRARMDQIMAARKAVA